MATFESTLVWDEDFNEVPLNQQVLILYLWQSGLRPRLDVICAYCREDSNGVRYVVDPDDGSDFCEGRIMVAWTTMPVVSRAIHITTANN